MHQANKNPVTPADAERRADEIKEREERNRRKREAIEATFGDTEVSLFTNAFDNTGHPRRLAEFITGIHQNPGDHMETIFDVWCIKKEVSDASSKGDKGGVRYWNQRAAALKKTLPAITVSALLKNRITGVPLEEKLVRHTGWLQCDFDRKENPGFTPEQIDGKLKGDPHVACAFRSPSKGNKAFVRIPADAARHKASFETVARHFAERHGLAMDGGTKEVVRLCYFSYDLNLYVNPDALPFEPAPDDGPPPSKKPAQETQQSSLTVDQVRAMLAVIPKRPDYKEWLEIASAVWDAVGEEDGTMLLKEWSPEEKDGEYADKYKKRLLKVKTGTLVHLAREHGYRGRTESADNFIYDGRVFHGPGARGELVPLGKGDVVRMLTMEGIANTKDCRALDEALNRIQTAQFALRLGPMAGFRKGWHPAAGGGRFYNTTDPSPVVPAEGDHADLLRLLREMLPGDQAEWFIRWLAIGHRSLTSGHYRPGQVLGLVGPVGCGKSLLIDLITEALGGRRAHPYRAWADGSAFNAHLAGSEVLVIDDESPSRDMRARRNLATSMKSSLFSGSVSIEAKYGTPVACRPWWRCVIACNDSPEDVAVLPPVDDSLRDKLALLQCCRPCFPDGLENDEIRTAFMAGLKEQLPGLLHYALSLPIDPFEIDPRTGIASYHHPTVLERLRELSKEALLEDLLLRAIAASVIITPWAGTAPDLHRALMESQQFCHETRRLAETASGMGYLMRDLAHSRPGMVAARGGTGGLTKWAIVDMVT